MLPWFDSELPPLYLAPMAGYTDTVYRALCTRHGADVLVSEFVLAESLIYGNEEAWEAVDFSPEQRPMGVQLFGSTPETMAEAARRVVARLTPDFIDLNFGCPSDKVVCKDAGSSLLRDLPRMARVAEQVARALPEVPVTAKLRIGWDDGSIVATEAARLLESAGMQAICIHGRTKVQGYAGAARWDVIGEAAETVQVPVIANGDITSAEDVRRLLRETRVRGMMIGRAALGYPWIFREIKQALKSDTTPPPLSLAERWDTILSYAELLAARPGRMRKGHIIWMRPKLIKLTKDMTGCKRARGMLKEMRSLEDLRAIATEHLERYRTRDEERFMAASY